MTAHPLDDLAAYALGLLGPDETRAIDAHLDRCAACRSEARAYAETAWALAAAHDRVPPPRLRAAIVERARADRRAPRGSSLWAALARPVPLAVPLGLAALLAVALVGYGTARRDADRYVSTIGAAAGARVVALAPTGPTTDLRGSLVVPANGRGPYLVVDLPPAPAGKTWEAWVIHAEVPRRVGVSGGGVAALPIEGLLEPGDTVAITVEAAGGVDAPTSAAVLAGKS